MKRELFRCDYCQIQKFNSETQEYINLPFVCDTLAQWKQHITRPKHCMNIARNNNLVDDLVVECKHCNGKFTHEQYKEHKSYNVLLWVSTNPIYKDCSCNNFVYNNKRFDDLNVLRAYAVNRYDTGRKKYDYIPKPKKIRSFADRAEPMKLLIEEKKAKKAKEESEKKVKKIIPLQEKIIDSSTDDEYDKLNNIKQKKSNKNDISIEPVWDDDELCTDCNKYTNEYKEYSKEKIKKWNIDICLCGEDSTSEPEDSDHDIKMTIDDIDDIDYTEKPKFYDYCNNCGYGLIDEGLSKNIYIKWELDYCECDEDSASEAENSEQEKII